MNTLRSGWGWKLVPLMLLVLLTACVSDAPKLGTKDNEAAASYNLQLGIDYFQQGNLNEAKDKLDRSLKQNPKNAQAWVVSGMLYDRLKEPSKAEAYFSKGLALDPQNGEVQNSYAVFLCRRGDYAKGEQFALKAANNPLYRTPEAAWLNAANCAADAKYPSKAEQYYRQAIAIRPTFAPALLALAQLELNQGNLLPARAFLERFLQGSKPSAESLWLAVRIERAAGNLSIAEDYARRLRDDFPTSNETKALLTVDKSKAP